MANVWANVSLKIPAWPRQQSQILSASCKEFIPKNVKFYCFGPGNDVQYGLQIVFICKIFYKNRHQVIMIYLICVCAFCHNCFIDVHK